MTNASLYGVFLAQSSLSWCTTRARHVALGEVEVEVEVEMEMEEEVEV